MKLLPQLAVLLACLLLTPGAYAAPGNSIQEAGTMIKTAYFSLTIPNGWLMPQPVKKQPKEGISAVFSTKEGDMAVTLNIFPAAIPARELARQTMAQMRKSGLRTSEPVEQNGLWVINLDGKAQGKAWFGSNGSFCAVTIIFGHNLAKADSLLKAIKETVKNILPTGAM